MCHINNDLCLTNCPYIYHAYKTTHLFDTSAHASPRMHAYALGFLASFSPTIFIKIKSDGLVVNASSSVWPSRSVVESFGMTAKFNDFFTLWNSYIISRIIIQTVNCKIEDWMTRFSPKGPYIAPIRGTPTTSVLFKVDKEKLA